MKRLDSPALRASIRGMSCLLNVAGACEYLTADPTVVPCHAPSEGKGGALKSSDLFVVAGCVRCHAVLDGRAKDPLTGDYMKREEREFYWRRGMQRQWAWWYERGYIAIAEPDSLGVGLTA